VIDLHVFLFAPQDVKKNLARGDGIC
jgi:hypothetical protein